jgi:hypothetical protein
MLSPNIELDEEYIEGFSAGFRFALIEVDFHLRKERFPPEVIQRINEVLAYLKDADK